MSALAAPVAEALVAAVAAGPGDTVLDLAAGTGDVTQALAERGARVISTDLSPVMVEAARRRGTPGVEYRVMDMQEIELPDESVDAVVSRFGYMLVPEPLRALRETRRVLRPGGRVAFATWAPANRNPWATAYGPILVQRGLMKPPEPGDPHQFALSEPEEIEAVVRAAGFEAISVSEVPIEFLPADWEAYRRFVSSLAAKMRAALEGLDEAERAEVDEAAKNRLEPYRTDSGYVLPGVALVTSAA